MMFAVELCSGAGGLTAGLARAGFQVLCSVDIDPDTLEVQEYSAKHLVCDISDFDISERFDLMVAGFPCQPFSSSGHRSGFAHPSGTVFERLLHLVDKKRPPGILLENVVGLLSNKSGHTFWSILKSISDRGYSIEWFTLDSLSFGIPQDRRRVFIAATEMQVSEPIPDNSENLGQLEDLVFSTRTEIGFRPERIHAPKHGRIKNGQCWHTPELIPKGAGVPAPHVGELVAPGIKNPHEVRSVRYWAHSGQTKAYFKRSPVAHAVGTSIGAAPLFGLRRVPDEVDLSYIATISSWSRVEPDGSGFVFRLNPENAVLLFGEEASYLAQRFRSSGLSNGAKYRLLGNMVIPRVGLFAAEHMKRRLNREPILLGQRL